jgi:hypothetical protein
MFTIHFWKLCPEGFCQGSGLSPETLHLAAACGLTAAQFCDLYVSLRVSSAPCSGYVPMTSLRNSSAPCSGYVPMKGPLRILSLKGYLRYYPKPYILNSAIARASTTA